MKIYSGTRQRGRAEVFVTNSDSDGHYLLPKGFEYVNHSPDGFEWGYGGSGPSQLAFAILHNYFKTQGLSPREAYEKAASGLYQDFKWKFVATWKNEWQITEEEITKWVEERIKNGRC